MKVGISWKEAKGLLALDRTKWKSFMKALCSTETRGKKKCSGHSSNLAFKSL
jgi:hypothetical protein